MPGEVFISYARDDSAEVSSLLKELQAAGVSVWVDERGIAGGFSWAREITAAIAGCQVLIIALSRVSAASENVQTEVALAHAEGKPILPVALEPVELPGDLKYYLAKIHRIDLHRGERGERIRQILSSLERFGVELRSQTGSADGGGRPGRDEPLTALPDPLTASQPAAGLRIAVLYRRHTAPDDHLLHLLQDRLTALGHHLLIDRHIVIGVEWAREIERQLQEADAVIPLLSAASVGSEKFACEIEIAHGLRQERGGRPKLLPIRVQYSGPLPETLAAILDPLEFAAWSGPADDSHLIHQIEKALRGENKRAAVRQAAPLEPTTSPAELDAIGGAVPLASRFYVVRESDHQFLTALARADSIVLVKGARQTGKTSLLARGLQQAREQGAKVVLTDFQGLGDAKLQSCDAFVLSLADSLADQLDLDTAPDQAGNDRWGPTVNLERFIRREVLGKCDHRIVWGLDEVDRLFSCPFGAEIFGLFRSWHNARVLHPDAPWSRLTQAIAYATEAHLFITDVNQSPFNVGTRVRLADFTIEQVAELNARYSSPLRGREEIARFFEMTNGHPYLVRRGLDVLATTGGGLDALESVADRDSGPFGDHLHRILVLLAQDSQLVTAIRAVLEGGPCPSSDSFHRLASAGILGGESPRDAQPRCHLYAKYLIKNLV